MHLKNVSSILLVESFDNIFMLAILIEHIGQFISTAFAKPFSKALPKIFFEKLFGNVAGNFCHEGCGNSFGKRWRKPLQRIS